MVKKLNLDQLQAELVALDPSAVCLQFFSFEPALSAIETPPSGTLAYVDGGGYSILLVFSASGTIAGVRAVKVQGNKFLLFTGTALPAVVLAPPSEIATHSSVKALEGYLQTIDPAATVTQYFDSSDVDESGSYYRIVTSRGRITVIRGAALGSVTFILDKGAEFVTLKT